MGKKFILVDTNILIKALRQDTHTLSVLDRIGYANIYISVITVAEILYGIQKREEKFTLELLGKLNKIHLDEYISRRFVSIITDVNNKRKQIPDALIAATALEYGMEIYTSNKKDFDQIKQLRLFREP